MREGGERDRRLDYLSVGVANGVAGRQVLCTIFANAEDTVGDCKWFMDFVCNVSVGCENNEKMYCGITNLCVFFLII